MHRLIETGTSVRRSEESLQLLTRLAPVCEAAGVRMFSTAGIHPHDAKTWRDSDSERRLRAVLSDARCVAVGECGLDFDRMFSPQDVQERVFIEHIRLANELGKPLFLHERAATDRMVAILREHLAPATKGIIHCFTGSGEALDRYLEFPSLMIGITGWVTDEREGRGDALRACVHRIPLEKLCVETDAPYLAPRNSNKRIKTNEPCHLPWVPVALAELMGVSEQEIAQASEANAARLFNLDD